MQYTVVLPFEEAGNGKYFNPSGLGGKRKTSGLGNITAIAIPTEEILDSLTPSSAYTSTETVEETGADVMDIFKVQDKWIAGGVYLLSTISVVFLALLLFYAYFPKEVSVFGFLIAAFGAIFFAWERHVRRVKQDR